MFNIANQLLTRYLPFALLGQIVSTRCPLWLLKNTEKSVSLTDSDLQTFLEGEETKGEKLGENKDYSYILVIGIDSTDLVENTKLASSGP